jgi:hypothetical protein
LNGEAPKIGYVVVYAGKVTRKGEALRLAAICKRYLTGKRKVPSKNIVVVDGGFRDQAEIELFAEPRGAPPPVLQPGLPITEVKFLDPR